MDTRRSNSRRLSAAVSREDFARGPDKGGAASGFSNSPAIELVRLTDLKPYPNNPRTHTRRQRRTLKAAMRRFGFIAPIIVDADAGIVCGELRVEIARQLGYDEIPAVRVGHLSEADLRALMIADNRIPELAEWDPERLAAEFNYLVSIDYDLELTGFETAEIDLIISGEGDSGYDAHSDDVPKLDEAAPAVSVPGDLWCLGKLQRLLCGNALDDKAYRELMAGKTAEMIFADPPYNVAIEGNVGGLGKIHHPEFVMASGEMTDPEFANFLRTAFQRMAAYAADGSIHYICMDWRHLLHAIQAGLAVYHELKNLCVWNKTNAGMGSFYRSKHEMVFVFKKGTAPHINNFGLGDTGRYRTNVWDYAGANAFSSDRDEKLKMHPTVKPAAMVADAMLDCSKRGGIILDSFVGSGTLFIAAELTGRVGYGMELDPRYVDVAIRRWQEFTGDDAIHAGTGLTFAETAAQRLSTPEVDIDEEVNP